MEVLVKIINQEICIDIEFNVKEVLEVSMSGVLGGKVKFIKVLSSGKGVVFPICDFDGNDFMHSTIFDTFKRSFKQFEEFDFKSVEKYGTLFTISLTSDTVKMSPILPYGLSESVDVFTRYQSPIVKGDAIEVLLLDGKNITFVSPSPPYIIEEDNKHMRYAYMSQLKFNDFKY